MPRLLHIADVHFDTGFGCKSERVRAALQSGVRAAFRRAVDDAIDQQVDAVLVAGDLFDSHRIQLETERSVTSEFERLCQAGIPVVYATGNHDPLVPSATVVEVAWPENVILLGATKPEAHEIHTRGGASFRVVGAGHDSASVATNLAATFPVFDDGVPTVGLLHTNVESHVSSREHRPYAPCLVGDLESKRYEYWALGHVHVPSSVGTSGRIHYSGCIQGRHFRESGPRGGYLITLEAGTSPSIEQRRYASVQWEEIAVGRLGELARLSELDDRVRELQSALRLKYPGAALAVRVVLSGVTSRWAELRDVDQMDVLAARWRDDFDLLHVEIDATHTHRPLDLDSLRSEPTILSEALSLVDELAGGGDAAADLFNRVLPEDERAERGNRFGNLTSLELESLSRDIAERLYEDSN